MQTAFHFIQFRKKRKINRKTTTGEWIIQNSEKEKEDGKKCRRGDLSPFPKTLSWHPLKTCKINAHFKQQNNSLFRPLRYFEIYVCMPLRWKYSFQMYADVFGYLFERRLFTCICLVRLRACVSVCLWEWEIDVRVKWL